jgi:hypothetical protein
MLHPTFCILYSMHPLTQKIAALQSELVWRRRITAACWMLAAAIGAAFVLGLTDYWLRFKDTGLRIMATSAFTCIVAWVAYRAWYLPSRRRVRALDVARRVEDRFPQLQDSLASAVEFLEQPEDDHLYGSAQLRRLVVAEAQNTVESLPLNAIVERRPLRRAIAALAVAAAAVVLCLVIDPGAVRTALARLAVPLGSAQWPRTNHLVFRNAPTRMAAGQTLEVELVDTSGPLPNDVRFEFGVAHDGGRDVTTEPMVRAGDTLVARKENVRHSFAFRATWGDDDTMPWHSVEVIEPPRLESLAIEIHPPAYTGLPAASAERHLDVLAGTGIEVDGTTSKPIKSAQILQGRLEPIAATISTDGSGKPRRTFHIAPDRWVAAKTGPYRLELIDDDGVAGVVGQWNLHVDEDSPPSVSWQQPADDLFVLPRAVVPLAVLVKDNLAIQQVDLTYERSDRSGSERAAQSAEPPIALYHGPKKPAAAGTAALPRGESRVVKYDWELSPLGLSAGVQLTIQAEAQDYRPGIGRTTSPRHVSIITPDELEARLADRQTQIVRQLKRALAIEQTTREDVRRLEIEQHEIGGLSPTGRNALQSAESNQRRVRRMLVDPTEGVPPLVASILAEIEMNRLESSPLRDTMEHVSAELRRLADPPLGTADRELTSARKVIETAQSSNAESSDVANAPRPPLEARTAELVARSLAATAAAQDEVITSLERLVSELSGKANYQRFAQLLAELRRDQIAHEESARAEIGLETLPLETSELTRSQRASLSQAATGQDAIAGRFDTIERGMDELAQQLMKDNDPTAGRLADAAALARQLNIGLDMRQTTSDLRENRVGRALDRETRIAANLQKVLDTLRNEAERKPQQVVDKLRAAERRLSALREQTAALRQQIADSEHKPATVTDEQRAQQSTRQQETRREIETLSRELERLQAVEASKSTQSAAKRLENRDAKANPPDAAAQRPSSSNQVQKAEQDLKQAADELAQRRQQAEDDLALEFVRRFQTDLKEMVERQQHVLKQTNELDAAHPPAAALLPDQAKKATSLADEERQLADKAKEHSELLFGLGAVRLSLEEAERRLLAAGKLLGEQQIGPPAQNAEQLALNRLEGMLQAFAQTANEAAPKPNPPPPNAGANNNPPQPQRRPTFELLQAKMLRMLQADLNERTQRFQERLAAPNAAEKAELQQEAQEPSAEQGRLVELVQSMLTRDNEQQQK